jgi:hypothetical protein
VTADVRSIAATPLSLASDGFAERGEARPGDLLVAFHSADNGSISDMVLFDGDGLWNELESRSGGAWAGTRIWTKIVGEDEPDSYLVHQHNSLSAGTVIILALKQADPTDIVVVPGDGSIAPAASPTSASGLEIRYAAGGYPPGFVSWAQLTGYSGLDVQASVFTTAAIAVRRYLSNSPVGELDLAPTPANFAKHAFTVLVGSAGGGGSAPTPPKFPASTPGKGESRLRYTVHDFLTGSYLADIYPSGVTLSRLISEPGSWQGRLSLANASEAEKINHIFPADPTSLLAGPGRLVVHTWRGGVLWGVHWIHTTETAWDQRGSIYMDVRGSTLDGYLNYVAVENNLQFDDDQIENARALILDMQANPASNPGLGLQPGESDTVRRLEAKAANNTRYGRVLQDYARAAGGFEYVVNPRVVDGSIIRSWEWGSPKLVGDGVHVFVEAAEGGTITSWREVRSALSGGTRWGAIGGTPQQEDTTQSAEPVRAALVQTPHIVAGWPIIDQRPTHPGQSTDQSAVDDFAKSWAARAGGAVSVFTFDAILGAKATLGPNSLGDQVRAVLNNPRYPIRADGSPSFNRSQRLIGWELTPADRSAGGKDKARLITETEVAEG